MFPVVTEEKQKQFEKYCLENNIDDNEKECVDYISNEETYPLCKGIDEEKCHNCCVYENYEEYHSP